jgi:sarcosine oxidase subunit beta
VRFDCIVIGGGVIGASIAYHLVKTGASVALVDPGSPSFPSASWASAGGVRRQNRAESEWLLTREASQRWPHLEAELGADCEFRAGGHLHLAQNAQDLAEITARSTKESSAGLASEVVDRTAIAEIAPVVTPEVAGGVFTRGDGHANPRLTTRAFLAAAARGGAEIRQGRVTDFVSERGTLTGVRIDADELKGAAVVIAAGSWSLDLTRRLGVDLPIRIQGLQMLLSEPAEAQLAPTVGVENVPISFKQLPSGSFLVGGGWPAEVDVADNACRVRDDSVRGSWSVASSIFPVLGTLKLLDRWCGIEAISFDGVPFIGPLAGAEHLYVATGFSGHGFQLAPAVGRAVADDLAGRTVPELAKLAATRMADFPAEQVVAFRSNTDR